MFKHRHHHVLMSALGIPLSAGAAAVAQAVEHVAVDIGIKATHAFTEQVCHFDTVAQLEEFLDGVADRHHWTRSDKAEIPAAPLELTPIDTAGSDQLAAAIANANALADATSGTVNPTAPDAPAPVEVQFDLAQLRTDVAAGAADSDAAAAANLATIPPVDAAAAVEQTVDTPALADIAATETPAATEQPATTTDAA